MIVHYYTEVEVPSEDVAERITAISERASSIGSTVYREGEALYSRIGPSRVTPAKKVELAIGEPVRSGEALVIPVNWWATGATAIFPRMDGDLNVAPLGSGRSSVSFQGLYEPPLGSMGRLLDRSLLRRVADSTVKSWVDQLVTAIIDSEGGALPRESSPHHPRR